MSASTTRRPRSGSFGARSFSTVWRRRFLGAKLRSVTAFSSSSSSIPTDSWCSSESSRDTEYGVSRSATPVASNSSTSRDRLMLLLRALAQSVVRPVRDPTSLSSPDDLLSPIKRTRGKVAVNTNRRRTYARTRYGTFARAWRYFSYHCVKTNDARSTGLQAPLRLGDRAVKTCYARPVAAKACGASAAREVEGTTRSTSPVVLPREPPE